MYRSSEEIVLNNSLFIKIIKNTNRRPSIVNDTKKYKRLSSRTVDTEDVLLNRVTSIMD